MAGTTARGRGEWRTVRGSISGPRLDEMCARLGAPVGPATRSRWQRLGLFPLPARRSERPDPRAAYHRRAPLLAALLEGLIGSGPAPAPEALRRGQNLVTPLRLRAAHLNGSLPGEERFYELVGEVLRRRARALPAPSARRAGAARSRPPAPAGSRVPRWSTTSGTLSAADLERACRARGVRMDRARRTYWQSERAFPQPERRRLRPPEGRGGVRGYYHAGAVALAVVIDYAVRPDHPSKERPWRCTVADVAQALAAWRADAGDEDALYRRIAGLLPLVLAGRPLPGLAARHRDVLPAHSERIPRAERQEVLERTGRAAAALADAWVAGHEGEPVPDRLVVWLRVERGGPGEWRIADAGARPTAHERRRRSPAARAGGDARLTRPGPRLAPS